MESQIWTVGVDTHKAGHSAALVDGLGGVEGVLDVEANRRGYGQLLGWARGRAGERRWVVEGTGSYGAGLASYLNQQGEVVYEGDRPLRRKRDGSGKSALANGYTPCALPNSNSRQLWRASWLRRRLPPMHGPADR